jgi:hypothetical protein
LRELLLVLALGEKHGTHAAVAEGAHDAIRADHRAGEALAFRGVDQLPHVFREKAAGLIVRREKGLDFRADFRFDIRERHCALIGRQIRSSVEEVADAIPEKRFLGSSEFLRAPRHLLRGT